MPDNEIKIMIENVKIDANKEHTLPFNSDHNYKID